MYVQQKSFPWCKKCNHCRKPIVRGSFCNEVCRDALKMGEVGIVYIIKWYCRKLQKVLAKIGATGDPDDFQLQGRYGGSISPQDDIIFAQRVDNPALAEKRMKTMFCLERVHGDVFDINADSFRKIFKNLSLDPLKPMWGIGLHGC